MRILRTVGIVAWTALLLHYLPGTDRISRGQGPDSAPADAAVRAKIESIDAGFQRGLRTLEAQRLKQLADLAASLKGDEAGLAYETLFRSAIDAELFTEAEPIAELVLKSGASSPVVTWLANVVNIFAEAERGAFRESLDSLINAIKHGDEARREQPADAPGQVLPLEARLRLEDAYFQRLVRARQYEIAREAFALLRERSEDPVTGQYAADRLAQLELIGKTAPPVVAETMDGKTLNLADMKGDVILLVFWASWCVSNAEQADRIDSLANAYRDQGFRLVGVNVDALGDDVENPETVLPSVRRFLIEHNVTWPNVFDRPGENSIAAAYAITDLPTSVLIGRDGKIRDLLLTGGSLEEAVVEALKEPKP